MSKNIKLIYKDHLHIRGEYTMKIISIDMALGSPPHTWRIQFDGKPIILSARDHLHIRGEYFEK